ncbi:hypothetical protein [Streptomyces carpinensis]|uniref:Uncharacterized protein n=1 Tax=Streptomyces carpinensis TaxID=66369 RepID=A0ABV1VWC3_9ACTN|nr:hypothetical protein [Streptomyces carpinensis]
MTERETGLPACARGRFEERQSFAALVARRGTDWHGTVIETIQGNPVLRQVDRSELRNNLLEVSPAQALDLARLISVGSLLYGPHASLRIPNTERDSCLRDILKAVGDGARFFTNHGHAEDGEEADFLASSFHTNALADTTIDVCLIGVSGENVLVLWRFEDD